MFIQGLEFGIGLWVGFVAAALGTGLLLWLLDMQAVRLRGKRKISNPLMRMSNPKAETPVITMIRVGKIQQQDVSRKEPHYRH